MLRLNFWQAAVFLSAVFLYWAGPSQAGQASTAQKAQPGLVPMPEDLALWRILPANSGITVPFDIVTPPGDTRLFIVDQPGLVRILDGETLLPTPFLDISALVIYNQGAGLRGLAFHPEYETNGYVYLWYDFHNAQDEIQVALARMQRSATLPDEVDPSSLEILLTEPQFIQGHAASGLHFGPDGMLYAALGDGGLRDDPECNAQNHLSLMGSVLRLDVDSAFPYAIPPDNPFVGDPNIRDESFVLGFRHPWSWGFDPITGDLWIADVGNERWEEVNLVPAGTGGQNFGWSVMEGSECFALSACPPGSLPCFDPGYTFPVYEYDHSVGCAIIGGSIYRGQEIPSAFGRYFFSDYCVGGLLSFLWDGQQIADVADHGHPVSLNGGHLDLPQSFERDQNGEILVIDFLDKEIFRLVSACYVEAFCPQPQNSTGESARLTWAGSTSVSANDLRMTLHGAPPGTPAHVFYAGQTTELPLGFSTLCVDLTTAYFRLPTFSINPQGRGHHALDFGIPPLDAGPGAAMPGASLYFQAWYRDVGAPTGMESSVSNALWVHFCP